MVVAKEFDSTTFFLSGNQLQLVYLKDQPTRKTEISVSEFSSFTSSAHFSFKRFQILRQETFCDQNRLLNLIGRTVKYAGQTDQS